MQLIISGKDKKLLAQVEKLAQKLGLKIEKQEEDLALSDEKRSEKLYQLMEEIAASGVFKSIKDPVAWQKEIRRDRFLPDRGE